MTLVSGKLVVMQMTFAVPVGEQPDAFVARLLESVTLAVGLIPQARGASATVVEDTASGPKLV